ncbi:unnamed protein product [Chrysoparadoxa australica]
MESRREADAEQDQPEARRTSSSPRKRRWEHGTEARQAVALVEGNKKPDTRNTPAWMPGTQSHLSPKDRSTDLNRFISDSQRAFAARLSQPTAQGSAAGLGLGVKLEAGQASEKAWAKEEDDVILACIRGRGAQQCCERWCQHLDPSLVSTPWTDEEDKKIAHAQYRYGNSWALIAQLLPGRTEADVRKRWCSPARKVFHIGEGSVQSQPQLIGGATGKAPANPTTAEMQKMQPAPSVITAKSEPGVCQGMAAAPAQAAAVAGPPRRAVSRTQQSVSMSKATQAAKAVMQSALMSAQLWRPGSDQPPLAAAKDSKPLKVKKQTLVMGAIGGLGSTTATKDEALMHKAYMTGIAHTNERKQKAKKNARIRKLSGRVRKSVSLPLPAKASQPAASGHQAPPQPMAELN